MFILFFFHFGFCASGTLLTTPLHSNVFGIVFVLSHTRGIILFILEKKNFLGHHEEKKKKKLVIAGHILLKKEPEKKEKKITHESPFEVFSCVCVGVVLGVAKLFHVRFHLLVLVEQIGMRSFTPHKPIYVAREVDRWLEKTPHK